MLRFTDEKESMEWGETRAERLNRKLALPMQNNLYLLMAKEVEYGSKRGESRVKSGKDAKILNQSKRRERSDIHDT